MITREQALDHSPWVLGMMAGGVAAAVVYVVAIPWNAWMLRDEIRTAIKAQGFIRRT